VRQTQAAESDAPLGGAHLLVLGQQAGNSMMPWWGGCPGDAVCITGKHSDAEALSLDCS